MIPVIGKDLAFRALGALVIVWFIGMVAFWGYMKGRADGFALGDAGRVSLEAQLAAAAKTRADELRALDSKRRDINAKTTTEYADRLAAADREYQRLRDTLAGGGADGVPGIPRAAPGADDTCPGELLSALRDAEAVRLRLEALQEWIRQQRGTSP